VIGCSLLIVDDDPAFRARLARAFADRGFEVRTAAGYDDAMDLVRAESPEWALVDLRMEGPSGLELLRSIREHDPAVRVVLLTGFGSIATAVDAMRLGASNYVAKPADVDDILAAFAQANQDPLTALDEDLAPLSLARVEWEHIQRVLSECAGNVSEAARRLGVHRRTLQRKLAKYPPGQ